VLALVTVTCTFFLLPNRAERRFHRARPRVHRLQDFGDVVALDAHFDGAESDFKQIRFDLALHDCNLVHRFETDLVADRYVLHHVRLGMRVSLVGPGAVRDHGLVEALLKLAAQARHAAFGFL